MMKYSDESALFTYTEDINTKYAPCKLKVVFSVKQKTKKWSEIEKSVGRLWQEGKGRGR